MATANCFDDEFIRLFESHGAKITAEILKITERSVYSRRSRLEDRTGKKISAPVYNTREEPPTSIEPPEILYYDIETTPIRVWTFRLGEQHINHTQIVGDDKVDIICITYCWDTGPAHSVDWGYEAQDSKPMIEAFDKIIAQADITIGQNSDSFDVKHINTQRMLHGLPPFPDWADITDDTLKQVRRHFKFPSNKLDYMSSMLGFGGKVKMDMQYWIDIVEKNENGLKSFNRMIRYGKKDVIDTRKVFHKIKPHIKPKLNMATFYGDVRCTNCGSLDIEPSQIKQSATIKRQYFRCNAHGGYAGRATILKGGKLGKMMV